MLPHRFRRCLKAKPLCLDKAIVQFEKGHLHLADDQILIIARVADQRIAILVTWQIIVGRIFAGGQAQVRLMRPIRP